MASIWNQFVCALVRLQRIVYAAWKLLGDNLRACGNRNRCGRSGSLVQWAAIYACVGPQSASGRGRESAPRGPVHFRVMRVLRDGNRQGHGIPVSSGNENGASHRLE